MSRRFSAIDDTGTNLAAYLREISQLPLLSLDEERALGFRVQHEHDEEALMRLVEANLRHVVSYAKRYGGLGVPFLDLIHEGNLGLIEAAGRFDPSRNVRFITDAAWWVRESMRQLLAEEVGGVPFPLHETGEPVLFEMPDELDEAEQEMVRLRFDLDDEPWAVRELEDRAQDKLRRSAKLRCLLN